MERKRWLDSLERLLTTEPGSRELLGGGRRVGTLRNRVREIRKFLAFVSST